MSRLEEFVRSESAYSGLAFREHPYGADERGELLRDLISLANADVRGARFLVLGVRDDAAGRAREFSGLTAQDWSETKRLLAAVLAGGIEPPLEVAASTLTIDGALVGLLCLKTCEDRPYLLGERAGEGLTPGLGWVRSGTKCRPLVRADLQRLFAAQAGAATIASSDLRVGFAPVSLARAGAAGASSARAVDADHDATLVYELTLPVLPLDAAPSAVAAQKLRKVLDAKLAARAVFGKTQTHISRLAHAHAFGAESAYEPKGEDTLRSEIDAAAQNFQDADAHYALELRAHPLELRIQNVGAAPLNRATLMLKLPRIDGLGVATELHTSADARTTVDGYPAVQVNDRTIEIRCTIPAVPAGGTVAASRHAARLWLRAAAAGKTLPVDYVLQASALREPLRDTLLIHVA